MGMTPQAVVLRLFRVGEVRNWTRPLFNTNSVGYGVGVVRGVGETLHSKYRFTRFVPLIPSLFPTITQVNVFVFYHLLVERETLVS